MGAVSPPEPRSDDEVRLLLPAIAEYGRIARVTAAGLAMRTRFDYRSVEDLRLAVDEALIALLASSSEDHQIELTYRVDDDAIVIRARRLVLDEGEALDADAKARFLLFADELLDEHEIERDDTTIKMTKLRSTSD